MNPVVHFEMPYDNRDRMAKFYGSAFGWQTQAGQAGLNDRDLKFFDAMVATLHTKFPRG